MPIFTFTFSSDVVKKNQVITSKSVLPRGWKVTLQVRPSGTIYGWSNILHATIGKNIARYGDRTPGIWFHSASTRLHICSAVNGNKNYCYNSPSLHRYKFTTITIQQVQKRSYGNHYFYQIYINGKKVVDVLNSRAQIFRNVKYYAGDPWYHAAKANIRNFRLSTFKHQGKYKNIKKWKQNINTWGDS